MTAETVATYRIRFHSVSALDAARRSLEAEGFDLAYVPDEEATQALDARLVADEPVAEAKLAAALAQVEHDPLIEWQIERWRSFRP